VSVHIIIVCLRVSVRKCKLEGVGVVYFVHAGVCAGVRAGVRARKHAHVDARGARSTASLWE
jgi:hypothetical protein